MKKKKAMQVLVPQKIPTTVIPVVSRWSLFPIQMSKAHKVTAKTTVAMHPAPFGDLSATFCVKRTAR